MPLLRIELLGSPVLRQRAAEVPEVDGEVRRLVAEMFETMHAAEGIGLAGPQVGVAKRVIVVDVNDERYRPMALVNPAVVESSAEVEKAEEGCLSIPGIAAHVERPARVTVEALDADGKPFRVEADGLLARCLQHEIDHLNGVLFIDYLSALKRSMLIKKYRQLQAEESEAGREKARLGRG